MFQNKKIKKFKKQLIVPSCKNNVQKKLVNSLDNLISGKVTDEKEFLDFYSLDSSAYSKRPRLIVFPKSIEDVKKTIRFAKKRKIPICARGGSTGLVGSSLTTGIIIDMKNFKKIKLSKNHVTVGAGVSLSLIHI